MIDTELLKQLITEKPRIMKYTKRDVELVNIDKIFTIIGPRRAGKTYFMFQLMDLLEEKGVESNQILYLNFEDDRLSHIQNTDFQKILDIYYILFPKNKNKKTYFMFDEIQNAAGWSKFVRRLYDKENCEIYITGSSSKLLSTEIATELRGRTWVYEIWPFSFKEYLTHKSKEPEPLDVYNEKRYKLINSFEKFLYSGGFPEVCLLDTKTECVILQNYADIVIFRDILERYNLTKPEVVKEVFRSLINNFSRSFSINNCYNTFKSMGLSVKKDYLYKLMSYLEDTRYFFFVPIYSDSIKVRMVNPKKVYVVDTGLVNCIMSKSAKEEGWFYENLAAIELIRRGYKLTYYRGKNECDFIARNKSTKEQLPIQITLSHKEPRELEGLLEAMDKLKVKIGLILTKDYNAEKKVKNKTVRYVSLWKWLLE